ncbi:hypothetical protein LTR85_011510 [Meristemomyces frigidus]|nr:hypothetical protein LTR85_011510 [Meristemomyces frigidus]
MSWYWPYDDPNGHYTGGYGGWGQLSGPHAYDDAPYGGRTAYRWYGDDSVPNGVFPHTQPDVDDRYQYQYHRPFGMIDRGRRDEQDVPAHYTAAFDYGIGPDNRFCDYTPLYERERREDDGVCDTFPNSRGEFGVFHWRSNGGYVPLTYDEATDDGTRYHYG